MSGLALEAGGVGGHRGEVGAVAGGLGDQIDAGAERAQRALGLGGATDQEAVGVAERTRGVALGLDDDGEGGAGVGDGGSRGAHHSRPVRARRTKRAPS